MLCLHLHCTANKITRCANTFFEKQRTDFYNHLNLFNELKWSSVVTPCKVETAVLLWYRPWSHSIHLTINDKIKATKGLQAGISIKFLSRRAMYFQRNSQFFSFFFLFLWTETWSLVCCNWNLTSATGSSFLKVFYWPQNASL